ncbi:hypothetical protein [Thioalkalivibrio sp. ALMg11]|uniref:hypothetical protein n=1 Tax=Thioalkalivibrio sp. ALMg11 TaxID=1158165 RepID=UPI00036C6D50|nr:hypothetical protein [Thioalkalivibrio sp. ALMg11]
MQTEDKRRISAELIGDDAVRAEVMATMLRIGSGADKSMTKLERDTAFVQLAMSALERVIDETRAATGCGYPSASQVEQFLDRSSKQKEIASGETYSI